MYYKNPDNPTCIDPFLINAPRSFQSACVLGAGLPDCYLMNLTALKKGVKNFQSRIINSRSYNNFSNENFKCSLLNELIQEDFINNERKIFPKN